MVTLVTADLELIDAALTDAERLGELLDAEVADGWVSFTGALQHTRDALAEDPASALWGTRLFLAGEPRALVGWGGFKGPPAGGVVELGYEIAPGERGRGLATEAVELMLGEAFAHPDVREVIAHTLPEPGPSLRVLEKCGFSRADAQPGPAARNEGSRRDADTPIRWVCPRAPGPRTRRPRP